ncbi:MAG: efflux RND transporter periplasmic adaptor subunit [Magnetococcales bacterium]|nr:efflux RND transporter periplasmic adaptor subunit [Magnetococcales bacterium]
MDTSGKTGTPWDQVLDIFNFPASPATRGNKHSGLSSTAVGYSAKRWQPGLVLLFCVFLGANSLALADETVKAVKVSITPISELLSHPVEEAQARVIGLDDVALSTEVPGIIARLEVEVGDAVVKGDVLAQIDDWSHRLKLSQEEAGLAVLHGQMHLARVQLERVRTLLSGQQASRERLDTAEAEVEVLKGRIAQQKGMVDEARARLDRTRLTAPFAGIVVERFGHVGGWIAPGSPIVRLLNPKNVEVSARVPAEALQRLKEGSDLGFVHQGQTFALALKGVIPLESATTGTREVRFTLDGERPVPGAEGRLQWRDQRPHLPSWVLVRRKGVLGLFVARDGIGVFQPLANAVEGGRTPWPFPDRSARVIVEGRDALEDGQKIHLDETTGVKP